MAQAEINDDQSARLVEALATDVPEATTIYLYGSSASGQATAGSDLDLALLGHAPIASECLARARESLSESIRRDVDLIDLSRVSTVMQAQVVSTGRILRDADPAHRERFEMRVYSAYARLNEERKGILERIQREGRIHGR